MKRRAFLRRLVPATAGIVIAPALALEALERKRYWPGFGAGTLVPVTALEHLDQLLRDVYVPAVRDSYHAELRSYQLIMSALPNRSGLVERRYGRSYTFPVGLS